jgi:outer membrane murein-binding lipoprotein Lpp
MKVIKFLPIFVISSLLLSACVSSNTKTTQPQTQAETTQQIQEKAESLSESLESLAEDLKEAPTAATTNSLEDLANYLKENKMIEGEPAGIPAQSLGAISGSKYNDVAIYEFDKDSDSYKGLLENGYVVLEGFGAKIEPTAINDKYMLICDKAENKDEVIEVFMNYK